MAFGFLQPKAIYAAEEVPGLIESLEKLQQLQSDQFSKVKLKFQSTPITSTDLQDIVDIKLESQFLRSILFQSESKLLDLIQRDECKFYSILENNLFKSNEGEIENLHVNIKYKSGVVKSGIMTSKDFFEEFYKHKCLNNREYKILFNEKNFLKTLLGIKYSVPKGQNDCKFIHNEWLINSYTPYLCKIAQVIKTSKSLSEKEKISSEESTIKKAGENYLLKIPLLQRNYIENLCSNLNDAEKFCSNYLKSDIWNKVINGEAPSFKLNYKCTNILNLKDPITLKDQKDCANKFLTNPKLCITNGNKDYSSYFPMPNCDQISEALNHSKLISEYHDCPGSIDNEAITNVHRIVNHFSPRKIELGSEYCTGEANYSFARLNLDIKYEKGWPLKICYLNRVEKKENCTQYIPGSRENEPLSEDQVVSKILYLQKGAPPKTKCKIVSSKKYNPVRTDYKFGCFIVYDSESCTTLSCNKKVIWEEKEQKDMRFIGTPTFEYYPSAYTNERYSVQNMIKDVKNVQSRTIKNLTDLKFYMDKVPSSIIHGIGCAEDLLPDVFNRTVINQCHPLPFIIDGYLSKGGEIFVVTRTAIDDLFSPRLIQWYNIYSSVSSYKELHPLNTWTLHGLKK